MQPGGRLQRWPVAVNHPSRGTCGGHEVHCGGDMPSKVCDAYVSGELEYEQEHFTRDW